MTYTEHELEIYERGRKAGFTAGRIQGISEAMAAMTDAGRAVAKATPRANNDLIEDIPNRALWEGFLIFLGIVCVCVVGGLAAALIVSARQ